jgi:BASS family bile acid:Na+ symporter
MNIIQFIKNWTLPISMITGIVAYFVFVALPFGPEVHKLAEDAISVVQPSLVAAMLFVSFCKVAPSDLKLRKWHVWLLCVQLALFLLCVAAALCLKGHEGLELLAEGGMLCFVCPTATAAAVVTGKLGGSAGSIVTYTLIINLAISFIAPVFLPMVHPQPGLDFRDALFMVMGKVFPLLVCPLMVAWVVRYLLPYLHRAILKVPNLAFYLWAVALAIAITVTTKSIVHSTVSVWYQVGLAFVSLVACVLQFYLGKCIGGKQGEKICGGQAFGQKNTVFIIWLGYTFLTPVTAVVGGFYSVWHNCINSWQLYKARKENKGV